MVSISSTEENYLKAIYKLSEKLTDNQFVSTNSIADAMSTRAASVTDMIKRLADKKLLKYTPYKGVILSKEGRSIATNLLRKHRLWEVFLVEKLDFTWAEVHPIAEQLEHIRSPELIDRLDEYLGKPKFDPHGDPIPDKNGQFRYKSEELLSDLQVGESGIVVGVKMHSPQFLEFLDSKKLVLGAAIKVTELIEFDHSMMIQLGEKESLSVSSKVSNNLYIQRK